LASKLKNKPAARTNVDEKAQKVDRSLAVVASR
jgi:hypothetical protein